MALAEGRLTPAQMHFAKIYAETRDAKYAAAEAGYKFPAQSASDLVRNPNVMARAQKETQKIFAEGQQTAARVLLSIVVDEKARNADRINAAKAVLEYSGYHAPGADTGKEAHEMTAGEIAAELDRLRAQADALETMAASNARLVEHVEAIDDQPADDLFG